MISDVYEIDINKFIENYIDFIKSFDCFMNINNIPSEIQNFIIYYLQGGWLRRSIRKAGFAPEPPRQKKGVRE